jgi:dihydroorotate dehydrogenase (fumarate)
VKGLLVGADVVMTTASLLRHGPAHVGLLRDGLATWMAERGYRSVGELRGAMRQSAVPDPDAFERGNYLEVLRTAASRFGA